MIPDHPYRLSIIEGSGSGKTNSLFNLISIYTLEIHMKQNINYSLKNNAVQF